ncbi:hypothetical protein PGTUg99_013900 [Puccinia graminis f. sp. tritici]|uniref:Secreted protein n=2 Tax=Puccinia graminis f. sp. tritici TaxID=56615 RepID=E3L4Y6_PUCGT|nr:uncharacterized protein PGTG_17665 [Puccinia graminis f. sp. tritici CRL 75-36-700-3]EFP91611.2 hypothetical protein PGTG_17665 [Puccinia graminis f. sp. tritici CRL 75-36-700-3]KAA1125364.1 hypothetical protein PGTUg99_013900 [Puccinia graminis f. sp. tritici]
MNRFSVFLCLALSIAAVKATEHSTCFNFFLKKDGCVNSSAANSTRCQAPPKDDPAPVQQFALVSQKAKRSEPHRVDRRYNSQNPVFPIGSGTGNCGLYDSAKELGVCLWSGAEQTNPTVQTAGWVNSLKTSNCGKRIYIHRTGKPDTVQYAKLVDGCSFNTTVLDIGCTQIGLSIQLFKKFNPSEKEQTDQLLYGGLTWDFDNLHGQSTQQAPV